MKKSLTIPMSKTWCCPRSIGGKGEGEGGAVNFLDKGTKKEREDRASHNHVGTNPQVAFNKRESTWGEQMGGIQWRSHIDAGSGKKGAKGASVVEAWRKTTYRPPSWKGGKSGFPKKR